MADMDLQIKIEASSDQAVKSIKTLSDRIRDLGRTIKQAGASGGLMALSSGIDTLGRSLDKFEKSAKQFGRDLTTYVTAPILALAGLSLRKIFQDAFEGIGTGPMLEFGAAVQNLKKSFDDLLRDVGEQIAPFATKVANVFSSFTTIFRQLDDQMKDNIIRFGLLAAAVGPVVLGISAFAGIAGKTLIALASITKVVASIVMAINPLVAVLVGVATALAGTVNLFLQLRKSGVTTKEALVLAFELIGGAINKYVFAPLVKVYSWMLKLRNMGGKVADGIFGTSFSASSQAAVDSVEKLIDGLNNSFDSKKAELDEQLSTIGSSTANAYTFGFLNKFNELKGQITGAISDAAAGSDTEMRTKAHEEAEESLKRLQETIAQTSFAIQQHISRGITDSLFQIADGTKSAGEAFADFARNTIRYLTQMVTQALIFRSLFPEGGVLGGITTRVAGASTVTPPSGFAAGGLVSGPGTGTSDSILARLSNGEFVSDAKTVKFFGPDFFHNLKRMAGGVKRPPSGSMIPGFATGGLVGGGGGGSAPSIVIQNSGSPKEAVGTEYDPSTAVTTVILEDLQKNGSIARGIQSTYGIRRGGYR